ncbi:COG1470 family protein [Cohnella abietis]|uniref:Uncharacterized protein n=1 Tax=Cohnella abietis TaxID=2507935 RepID=A0A3T1DCK8_9BACL|nr:hypothetical protein [Cohnella abietis]BBI35675.1 hypothetical protein KCTCHS21_50740 [Cohnella abietis]
MKKVSPVRLLILFFVVSFLLFGCYLLVLYRTFATPIATNWIKNTYDLKSDYANSVKGNKILITSGSNGLFGIRAKDIEEQTGIPTVNFATNAALQIDYIIYRTKEVAKSGDVIIMPLEYEYLIYEGEISKEMVFYSLTWDKAYYRQLPLNKKLEYLFHISARDYLKGLKEQYLFDGSEFNIGEGYTSKSLNKNGDYTSNIDLNVPDITPYNGLPDFKETFGLQRLKSFKDWCIQNNINLYITFPAVLGSEPLINDPYFEQLLDYFNTNNFDVLGTPKEFIYEDINLFFDSLYHLNQTGMTLRTESLIKEIKNSKVITQIEPTLAKTNNVNQQYATTSENPLPMEGFQFEISLIKADTVVQLGEPIDVEFSIKNTSPIIWPAKGLKNNKFLIYPGYTVTSNGDYLYEGRFAKLLPDVQPGETKIIRGQIIPTSGTGSYTVTISVVQEEVAWFHLINPQNVPLSFEVIIEESKPTYWKMVLLSFISLVLLLSAYYLRSQMRARSRYLSR